MTRASGLRGWWGVLGGIVLAANARGARAAEEIAGPSHDTVRAAVSKAVILFHERAARQGGYLWRYTADLSAGEGEGSATDTTIWIQPPGTPSVGEAMLAAYEATGDRRALEAAHDAARALVRSQLHSGGWYYHADFDREKMAAWPYRSGPRRRSREYYTTLDDDTTQAALRLLTRVDQALAFEDRSLGEAVRYGLEILLDKQYPNGAWFVWWERYAEAPAPEEHPIVRASYPDTWPRTWTKEYPGCYVLNDNLMVDMIDTLVLAADTYRQPQYEASALRAADFLLLARMPEPQPAWAQQYDRHMHPCWSRKFEPPAISGRESQDVLAALMRVYQRTGDRKYLEPVAGALAYLRRSQLSDGRLARFYELNTNQPLYFTRDYQLTYDSSRMPTHYGFIVESRLDELEARYRRLSQAAAPREQAAERPAPAELAERVRAILSSQDQRGAWVQPGRLKTLGRDRQVEGVIESQTFIDNVLALCAYLRATR